MATTTSIRIPDPLRHVLGMRGHVARRAVPSFIRNALGEIRHQIEMSEADVEGPPFVISRAAHPSGVDVEVGWPVDHADGTVRIHAGSLPPGLARLGQGQGAPTNEPSRHAVRGATVSPVRPRVQDAREPGVVSRRGGGCRLHVFTDTAA